MLGVKGIPHTGGIENVVEQLGSRLAARGHEVIVYVRPHYTPRSLTEYRSMRLVHLPSVRTKHLDAITHTFLAAWHAVFSGADIAHIHSIGLSILAPIPRMRGIKTIVQSHGLDWQREKWGPLIKTFLKMTDYSTVYLPHATTVVSRRMQRYYESKFGRRVTYIPNGVNDFAQVEPHEIYKLGLRENDYILFASRLVPEKGCHHLLRAYKELGNPTKKLVIAGDSNYGDRYAAELKRQGDENILFLGFVKGRLFEELMSHAYVYVQPSEIEGLSTALLEAMSYRNCVLVSDIEENLEVIGDCGFAFRNKNPEDLRAKLEYLLANKWVVEEYRAKAEARVSTTYSWDDVTDQYEALYHLLLKP
jgi:glycosyltransferase involved in cell wall biosynthesis